MLEDLLESHDFEAKLAHGRDGQGEVPRSLWETYSAFANTDGGVILLGVQDNHGVLTPVGLANPQRVVDQLWTDVNNKSCVSANLLRSQDVSIHHENGVALVRVLVPRAARSNRPVYVGANPLDGSFRRRGSADQKCSAEEVRRMLAEQVEESRDERICVGLHVQDLNEPSIRRYRQRFQAHATGHPWNSLDDDQFLRSVGAWRRDRETGRAGVTLGGLLMFGRQSDIIDEFPNYFVDYQERAEARTERRWIERVCLDGTWSGNLYDFYNIVIGKLAEGLGAGWQLRGDQRIDDSPVHQALREALVNTLIHADYTGRTSVLVVKRPDLFGFRNPGAFRLPLADAQRGGDSDCRNRRLQAMFRLVGFGDQAGSGLPKILDAWHGHQWRMPKWTELVGPNEQTQLELPRASLLSPKIVTALREQHGVQFDKLPLAERLALALAVEEGEVTHTRLTAMSGEHSREATLALQHLVQRGLLVAIDRRRPVTYAVAELALQGRVAVQVGLFDDVGGDRAVAAPLVVEDSLHGKASSMSGGDVATMQADGVTMYAPWPTGQAPRPSRAGKAPSDRRRIPREELQAAVLAACAADWRTVAEIAAAVARTPSYLRNEMIPGLVEQGLLVVRFPGAARHPRQAYRAAGAQSVGEER
ncbi:MAG: RNA-binding domain-containing protein [Myxococcota bacterium]